MATAANALASIGDSQALPHLLPLFADPHAPTRQAAVAAVNSIAGAGTEAQICALLLHADAHVRECAIRVAGYFGYDDCGERLVTLLADPNEAVRRAAIEQMPLQVGGRGTALLIEALRAETPRNRAAAAHALRSADGPGIADALLAATADPDPWVRYFAALSLSAHTDPRAAGVLSHLAEHDLAPQVRIAGLRTLGEFADEAILPLVGRVLRQSDEDVACEALSALRSIAGSQADEVLREALADSRHRVRSASVGMIAARPTPAAVQLLLTAARLPIEPALGDAVIDQLGAIAATAPDAAAKPAAMALLELGSEAEWRARVVSVLAGLPPRAVSWLRTGLSAAHASHRRLVVDALGRQRHAAASAALLEALDDEDADVRRSAVSAFARLGSLSAADAVARLAVADPDPAVRRRADVACRRHGWLQGRSRHS
jgi:HEAT repeat protein